MEDKIKVSVLLVDQDQNCSAKINHFVLFYSLETIRSTTWRTLQRSSKSQQRRSKCFQEFIWLNYECSEK